MKAAIYTRFSSDNQTELSTQAQVRACTEYAKANGLDIYKIYSDEAISGTEEKTDHRLQYQLMLQDAKQKRFDVLLIHKYDRVARSLEEHVRLSKMMEREKIPIIAVAQNFGTSIEGDFAKQMMWVLSEYYSKNLSKEVRKGHREIALKGLHNGGPAPFGFRVVDQKLVINDLEAFYVRKMFDAALNRRTRSMRVSMCTRWKGAATASRGWRHRTPSGWMGRSRRSWTKIHFSRCKKSWMIVSRPGRTRESICAAGWSIASAGRRCTFAAPRIVKADSITTITARSIAGPRWSG